MNLSAGFTVILPDLFGVFPDEYTVSKDWWGSDTPKLTPRI
jgi:hypothetical protein